MRTSAFDTGRSSQPLPSMVDGCDVIAQGVDAAGLLARDSAAERRWILVEDAGEGAIAIGPLFGPGAPVCVHCYLGRRASHGSAVPRLAAQCAGLSAGTVERQLTLLARAEAQHARQYVIDRAGRVSEHVILALPSCARCARVARLADPLPLEAAVSARVGLVHETYDVAPADALLPTVCVRGCRSDAFHATRALNGGIAADVSRERARVRAIAESLERYCLAFVNRAIRVATAEALGEPWITPAGFPLEQEISWTRAHRIVDGAAVWVPAAAVFLPLDAGVWGDRGWIQTSNGTAAGPTLEAALRSALLEMEERDTFIRAWRANAVPAKCAVQAMVPGMHLACVPSAWGPPVVAAFLEQPMPPLSAAGLACRLDLEDAVQAAQLEAVAAHALFTEQIRAGVTIPEGPPRQLVHHGLAHALRPELRAARASWLAPRGSYVPGPSRPLEQACVIDLTTPDVAAFGVHVVRVVRPDRLGLDHDATRPALSGNPDPHPIS